MSGPGLLRPRQVSARITILILAGCTNLTTPTERTVQIQRTTYGVAHVQAPDFEALAYGVAYAQAQDNICQTAEHLVTVRGERSRFFGPAAQGLLGLRALPNDQIDLFIRSHMDDAALAAANATTSTEAKAMALGYVSGYNRFLLDYADRLPAPCKGQPWARPMTLGDFNRLSEHPVIQLGVGALAGAVVAAHPPQATAPPRPEHRLHRLHPPSLPPKSRHLPRSIRSPPSTNSASSIRAWVPTAGRSAPMRPRMGMGWGSAMAEASLSRSYLDVARI